MPASKFDTFKSQFKTDTITEEEGSTGLAWNENIPMYVLYFKARIIDDFLNDTDGRFADASFRNEFAAHTGLEWDQNLPNYILYYRDRAMEDLMTELNSMRGRITALEGKVSTLEGKVSTLEGKVSRLEGFHP